MCEFMRDNGDKMADKQAESAVFSIFQRGNHTMEKR
jgi:hypothetical protein